MYVSYRIALPIICFLLFLKGGELEESRTATWLWPMLSGGIWLLCVKGFNFGLGAALLGQAALFLGLWAFKAFREGLGDMPASRD